MRQNHHILLLVLLTSIIPVFAGETNFQFEKQFFTRTVQETLSMKEAMGEKCQSFSSQGLADYSAKSLTVSSQTGAKLNVDNGSVWEFSGDSACIKTNACKITIDVNGAAGPNVIGKDKLIVPIYKKSNGFLSVSS